MTSIDSAKIGYTLRNKIVGKNKSLSKETCTI